MSKIHKLGMVVLGTAISLSAAAHAAPKLQIVDSAGALKTAPISVSNCGTSVHCEVIGDRGGTSFPWPANTPGGGAGIPTINGGWIAGAAGFAADPSFGNAVGTTGWHASYLKLTQKAKVTFQFMGAGDSAFVNSFFINTGSGFTQIFRDGQSNAATNPCSVGPSSAIPVCDKLTGGFPNQNQYTALFGPGLISFAFGANGTTPNVFNDGTANGDISQGPGFFLGIDPYLATGVFQNTGTAAYAGLTDQPSLGDHDFQDMGVRISAAAVPEPASWAMMIMGLGFSGLALRSRNRPAQITA
jgi:hypothetical protein